MKTILLPAGFLLLLCWKLSAKNGVQGHESPVDKVHHLPCLVENGLYGCRDGSECIDLEATCNGAKDCSDGSDEGGRCAEECGQLKCTKTCRKTPVGPVCSCPHGFHLDKADNVSCIDVNECSPDLWPPVCSQQCNNVAGSFACSCAKGYILEDDLIHCRAYHWKNGFAYLVYTQFNKISIVGVGIDFRSIPSIVKHARGHITALALDISDERIYYYDSQEFAIKSIDMDGENEQNFIINGLTLLSGMSIDWVGHNVYISEHYHGKILACSISLSICTDLNIPNIKRPRSLVVDSVQGKLYWSDCGNPSRIMVSNLDGSEPELLVREGGQRCATSLFVDQPSRTLYWTEADRHIIGHIQLDSPTRKALNFTSIHLQHSLGVAVFKEELYWSNSGTDLDGPHTIAVANKYSQFDRSTHVVDLYLHHQVDEMALYHGALQMEAEGACDKNPCQEICLLRPQNSYACACMKGKKLNIDQKTCIDSWDSATLLVASKNSLLNINPDAAGLRTFETLMVNGVHNITALAYDSANRMVYYGEVYQDIRTSAKMGSISRFSLNDPGKVEVMFRDILVVTKLSIDWISRNIYWIDNAKNAIEVARLDGVGRMVLKEVVPDIHGNGFLSALTVDPIQLVVYYGVCRNAYIAICDLGMFQCRELPANKVANKVTCITDIVADQKEKKLYFSDSGEGVIYTSDLGLQKLRAIRHSTMPNTLAVISGRIFWTDIFSDDLQYHRLDEEDSRYKIYVGENPLGDVLAIDAVAQPFDFNACSKVNGECSHVCVPITPMSRKCLCPVGFVMQENQKTCTGKNRIMPVLDGPTPTQSVAVQPRVPSGRTKKPSLSCLVAPCLGGGTCMERNGRLLCVCPEHLSGPRCENSTLTGAASAWKSVEENSHLWVAGVLCGLIIVMLILLGVVCFMKRRSNLPLAEAGLFRIKAFFQRASDDDIQHKKALVNPSYENPGYVDMDDEDMQQCNKGRMIVVAPSIESIDSAYLSRKEYPSIKRLDTATVYDNIES